MSQSTPQAPSPSKPPSTNSGEDSRAKIVHPPSAPSTVPQLIQNLSQIHNISLGALIVCPIVILLPPRKLDIYTLALLSGTFAGGNQLSKEYTGVSILERFGNRLERLSGSELPPKAKEMQTRLREEKLRREEAAIGGIEDVRRKGEELSRLREQERGQKEKERGLLEKVWMGNEGDDWKEKRDRREREALEEGKGYWDLIKEQIWDVWSSGEKKVEELKEVDEKVVKERKKGEAKK